MNDADHEEHERNRARARVFFAPDEEHWHGASPTRFMAHLAMLEVDDEGNRATWGNHVSEEEYGTAQSGV